MSRRLKTLMVLAGSLALFPLNVIAGAQSASPATRSPRPTSRQPYFIIFNVQDRTFSYRRGMQGGATIPISGDFVVRPNDLVYFRAVNYDASKLKVRVSYQPVPPNRIALPSSISTLLPTLSASDTAGAQLPSNSPAPGSGSEDSQPGSGSTANRLLDLLAAAVSGYSAASTSPEDIKAAIADVQNKARTYLRDYILTDPAANRAVAEELIPRPERITTLDAASLQEQGVHYIYLIAAAKAKTPGAPRNQHVYDRYIQAAEIWRHITDGTIFDAAIGPELADDTVGQMVWKVEVSDAANADAAVSPYRLTITKKDIRNLEFAVSANIVGSLLQDSAYYKDAKGNIALSSRNEVALTTGPFLHVLFPGNRTFRPAVSFGVTAETTPKYMIGGSLIGGYDQRIVLTAGLIIGQVQRLGDGLSLGGATPADGNITRQSVTRSALFFSLGFKF